ncbi:hypothetical protein NCAS_0A12160 [Naumovozyma castellii]|uniref:Pre-mRNA-splicing factor SYF1 n=1 Tax=Naumovozyma castellii TaxID=27288 RepID=G0V8H6_NAUCA|nr:hypothetical protein NCAS_0A12160 [Naumovozyma castellii CBS 4309]CCC67774.1 hypothetical protein NCAS_0A12160 [Naumovozyma castellii CBS 4309]
MVLQDDYDLGKDNQEFWNMSELIDRYIKDEEDVAFEYELQGTPQSLLTWKRYLEHWKQQGRPSEHIEWLYERSCLQFKDNQDVWEEYLKWLLQNWKDTHETTASDYWRIANVFKRCINAANGKPFLNVSLLFLEFAMEQRDLKLILDTFDMTLKNVKTNDQGKLWNLILKFVNEKLLSLTFAESSLDDLDDNQNDQLFLIIYQAVFVSSNVTNELNDEANIWASHLLERFIQVCNEKSINMVLSYFYRTQDHKRIKRVYEKYLISKSKKSSSWLPNPKLPYQLNINYLNTLEALHRDKEYEAFMGEMRKIFPEESTNLIIILCSHYVKRAEFQKFEKFISESLTTTISLKDFTTIFNFQINVEQILIETVVNELKDNEDLKDDEKWNNLLNEHLKIFQNLVDTRKLKTNDLKLRQDPNNVSTWQERVSLFKSNKRKCEIFTEAILAIDPLKVSVPGSFGNLWCDYAQIYWDAGNYDVAREIYDRALKVPFPFLDDLTNIWTEWVEKELDLEGIEKPIQLLEHALEAPEHPTVVIERFKNGHGKVPAQTVVFNSSKLWSIYIDLLETLALSEEGDEMAVAKVIKAYEQTIKLKVITPLRFINYSHFLQHHNMIMESYQIYERAIPLFTAETQYELWNIYLAEVVNPLSPLSKEHIRELFEHAIRTLLPFGIDCKSIFILYSDFEEKQGLLKRSVDILWKGAQTNGQGTIHLKSRLGLWNLCLFKAQSHLGLSVSRQIYEDCIQQVPNSKSAPYIIGFADAETSGGEITRSREILEYGARLIPPAKNTSLWNYWETFELKHGDKETYKDMLKLKRKLDVEMRVDTEQVTTNDGNVQFVASTATTEKTKDILNTEEIELDI